MCFFLVKLLLHIYICLLLFQLFLELLEFLILCLDYLEQDCAIFSFAGLLQALLRLFLVWVLFLKVLNLVLRLFAGPGGLLREPELKIL